MKSVERPSNQLTAVARLMTDAITAARLQNALAECCDGEAVAVTTSREDDERWSLTLHFRGRPDEAAVRDLISSVAGKALARDLAFEVLAPTDWVRRSLDGLQPVEAGRFVVHGAHDRHRVGVNRIAIQIEAALAFGTGHHGSTRGCLPGARSHHEDRPEVQGARRARHRHRDRRACHRRRQGPVSASCCRRHRRPGGSDGARKCAHQSGRGRRESRACGRPH